MTYNHDPSAAAVLQRPDNVISSDQLPVYTMLQQELLIN